MLINGDCLTVLKTIDSETVDCIITSPPYWALRDYKTEGQIWDSDSSCEHEWKTDITKWHSKRDYPNCKTPKEVFDSSFQDRGTQSDFCLKCKAWKGQLGQEPTIELYINHLIQIFNECKRVLKKEGTCWIVLGDTYAQDSTRIRISSVNDQRRENNINNNIVRTQPQKSLCLIPERFAIKMIDNGWILRNKIIWHKPNCMPSSATDRFTVDFEYIYFFVKSKKYYFKTQYEPYQTITESEINQVYNGQGIKDYEDNNVQNPSNVKRRIIESLSEKGRIKRTVWKIPPKPFKEAHFAVFPEELVKQCIEPGCPEQGTVLDPFSGAGTTALVALKTHRNFIGIELNPDYIKIAQERIRPYIEQTKLVP